MSFVFVNHIKFFFFYDRMIKILFSNAKSLTVGILNNVSFHIFSVMDNQYDIKICPKSLK